MTGDVIESPYAGGKMRASWGASVARALNAHESELQSLRQPGKWQSLRTGDELAPFTVRLHKTEDDPDGLWEIYLPPGCCNVGGTCDPLNPKAYTTSGHEGDDPYWYSLGTFDWDSFGYAEYWNSGAGAYTHARRVYVDIHVKPSAKLYGVDGLNIPARRLVWASLRDASMDSAATLNATGIRRYYKDTPGDAWVGRVATISQVSDNTSTRVTVAQHRTTPVDVALPQGTGVSSFDLVWSLAPCTSSDIFTLALEVKNLFCVRQSAAAAGIMITGDTMTDVLDASSVYARVNVTDLTTGSGIVDVLKDPQGVNVSTPYVVWLPLYDLKHNTVTADHRAQSLVNLQLFHA